MNKFAQWLYSQDKNQAAVAKNIGISTSTLHEIVRNDRIPNLKTAFKIEVYTNGSITLYDWLDQKCINSQTKNAKKHKRAKTKKTRNSGSFLNPPDISLNTSSICSPLI